MQDLRTAALATGGILDGLAGIALQGVAGDEPAAPPVLRLLLRLYATTGRDDLEAALGPALARALDAPHAPLRDSNTAIASCDWLTLFVDAAALSPDERLSRAAADLVTHIRREWPAVGDIASAMRSVDACLRASQAPSRGEAGELIAAAIDELERIVGPAYRPGEGIAHTIGAAPRDRGDWHDHVSTASALLTAYTLSGRLPYSMLAEELMRLRPESAAFPASCSAVTVYCRLAALHGDPDYRAAAVIAPDTDYAADAERLLQGLTAAHHTQHASAAAEYGLALFDWLALGGF